MSRLNHYSFSSVWLVEAPAADVFEVLRDLGDYSVWWPEVKEVHRVDDDTTVVRCRALLPYDLRFTMRRSREDPTAGVLEVAMSGDLEGFSRWTISSYGDGASRLLFEEEVATNKKLLNQLAPVARPAFTLNHALMMRHGHQGLRVYLAGFRRARSARYDAEAGASDS